MDWGMWMIDLRYSLNWISLSLGSSLMSNWVCCEAYNDIRFTFEWIRIGIRIEDIHLIGGIELFYSIEFGRYSKIEFDLLLIDRVYVTGTDRIRIGIRIEGC